MPLYRLANTGASEVFAVFGGKIPRTPQWKPQKQLSYTWNVFAPGDSESNYPESYLDLTLEQKGEEVRLTLFHLPVPQSFVPQTQMGWHTFLDLIEAGVCGKPQEAREAYMQNNAKLYGVDLDNLAH